LPLEIGDIDRDGDVDSDDIRYLTKGEAVNRVYRPMWEKYPYGYIVHQKIAVKLFDLVVNMGPRRVSGDEVVGGAHLLIQRAVRSNTGPVLVEDGLFGPKTLNSINLCKELPLLTAFRSEAAGYYRIIAQYRNNQKFLKGWLNRAYW
jgi:lysozyme family protein